MWWLKDSLENNGLSSPLRFTICKLFRGLKVLMMIILKCSGSISENRCLRSLKVSQCFNIYNGNYSYFDLSNKIARIVSLWRVFIFIYFGKTFGSEEKYTFIWNLFLWKHSIFILKLCFSSRETFEASYEAFDVVFWIIFSYISS